MKSSNDPSPRILALIPAYNEEERIGEVISRTMKALPVLVVDDGSTDDTSGVAGRFGAAVLRQFPNQGKGAALRKGFGYALENGYDAVITLDADGQHNPAEIPLFLSEFARGADLVIGKRDFNKMPFPRNFSNTIGSWLFSKALGEDCPDNQSGYRLHSKRMIEASMTSREMRFEFEVEMIVRCKLNHLTLTWVPIQTIYWGGPSHIKPLRHVFHFIRMSIQTRKEIKAGQLGK